MEVTTFLDRLQQVKPRGAGKWSACCPSHQDKTPSLAISEGTRGLLVKCWSGCTVPEICGAMGLQTKDLFFDQSPLPSRLSVAPVKRPDLRSKALELELHALGLKERAEAVLRASTCHDGAPLTDFDIEEGLKMVGQAYKDIEHAQVLFDVSDGLKLRAFRKEGGQ